MKFWGTLKNFYLKYEDHLSASSLVAGFLFDIYVLTRIDRPEENLWIISHLIVAIIGILILNYYENLEIRKGQIDNPYYWLTIVVQFAFGGLLSTFLVFYFRSAVIADSWPFLLLLAVAFICNEVLKQHYSRLTFQISYFFLCTFLFSIYYVPIVLGEFGSRTFIYSGLSSLIVTAVLIHMLLFLTREKFKKSARTILASIVVIYFGIHVLYFSNIIPPIPLSLKDAGVFHSIARNDMGNYDITYEWKYLRDYLKRYERFSYLEGDTVYVYSAIFSPTNLNVGITHEWQYYDAEESEWISAAKVPLYLVGGREGGYRTYSSAKNVFPGFWRVVVKTDTGQVVGKVRFELVAVKARPLTYSGVKS